MNSSNDLNTVELLDDIDNLLFLCDRLSNRLIQVASYVDEVKQTWTNKRRSVELDSNASPIIMQKATKYNKVLLNVAEKLAIVELQTESLHNLQSSLTNTYPPTNAKRNDSSTSSISVFNQAQSYPSSISVQMNHPKNETINTEYLPQRDASSTTSRSLNEQRVGFGYQNALHVSTTTTPSTNTFTARSTATLFSAASSSKQPIDQFQSQQQQQQQQQSAFRRPLSGQENITFNPQRSSSQNLLTSQTPQKSLQNGTINGYQQQLSNVIIPRPAVLSDSYSPGTMNDSTTTTSGKIRIKMQLIKAGTIWYNADIPIIDHPSAFFVCNQDPRVAEQFHMMSIEMNNHYNKQPNTTAPLQNPSIGDFCVARFSEDNLWYRARVVLIHGNESILIVFIDYGNSETKPANEIYPLQESLARLPAMTVACTLAESFPRNENFWTTEATEIFIQLVKNRIVEVHFQPGSGQQWPLHFVKIMLDGQSIAQHPKLAPYITTTRNEQIAMHFNDKLTSMEYILYNVAVVESDIYNGTLP